MAPHSQRVLQRELPPLSSHNRITSWALPPKAHTLTENTAHKSTETLSAVNPSSLHKPILVSNRDPFASFRGPTLNAIASVGKRRSVGRTDPAPLSILLHRPLPSSLPPSPPLRARSPEAPFIRVRRARRDALRPRPSPSADVTRLFRGRHSASKRPRDEREYL